MIAASVANSMNINIDETNIGKSAAHAHAKKKRVKIAKSIKGKFKKPRRGILHWDGKILKVKGSKSSNRVAFYITGATYKKEKKLLGCPETEDGTEAAEAKVVTDLLTEWELKPEICGMVFDTTSSNTGAEIGACKLVEDWLERPILWCGCRRHVCI